MKYLSVLISLILIIQTECKKPISSSSVSVSFKREPDNNYIIDSSSNSPRYLQLDCSVESISDHKIKWQKDNVDLNENQIYFLNNEEIKSETLTNGSLNLSFKLINSTVDASVRNKFELIASFKCLAMNAYGKIVSRSAKVYRYNSFNDPSNDDSGLKFLKQPDNTTITSGRRLLLKCKPSLTNQLKALNQNTSQIQYKWYKDGKQVIYSSRMILHKDGSLEIPQISENDSGAYKCEVKYKTNMFVSRVGFVKVASVSQPTTGVTTKKSTPAFMTWPEDQSAQEHDEVVMDCMAYNDAYFLSEYNSSYILKNRPQFYTYKWLKDGVALDLKLKDKSKRMQLIRGNSLRIERLEESDSATYTCRICNSNLEELAHQTTTTYNNTRLDISSTDRDECDERSGVLRVLVSPKFLKRPVNVNATIKSDVEFECSVYGVPKPTVQWFKNGEPIYPSEYFQFNSNQGSLKILGIIAQDEGYYQCLASNELNTIQSVAQLSVAADEYSINENDDYDLDYTLNKNEKISSASHTKQTQPFIQLSAPANLTVINKKSRSFQIEWKPPALAAATSSLSNLTYEINWKAKTTDRQRELNTSLTSILIDELTADTVYLVQVCAFLDFVKGPCATLEAKTDTELAMPGPPSDFKAEFIDLNSDTQSLTPTLKFKWKKPNLNADSVVKYRLYYQHLHYGPASLDKKLDEEIFNSEQTDLVDDLSDYATGASTEKSATVLTNEKYLDIDIPPIESPDQFYEFLLEDLLKYSTYKFSLVALNKQMLSELDNATSSSKQTTDTTSDYPTEGVSKSSLKLNSADLIIETQSDVPDGPPENLQIETINTTSVLFQWDMPALEKRNGIIVGYKISIKENDKQIWHSNEDSEPRKKIINGLLPFHKYSVRVTARTQNGSGPASEWIIAETFTHEMDESKVPGQPVDLFTEPTDKSIVIRWLPPADSNKTLVRKYLLKYGIGFPINEVQISGTKNSYIINDLTPSSPYVISLKAANNMGYGMEILKDVITKRKSALGENENLFPPLNVQAVVISAQSIEVRWTDWHLKPEEQIPDDRYYVVRYNIADMSSAKYKYKNSTERNVIITDLKSSTLYDFAVRLVIGSRESDWSMTTSQMTMESAPAPRDISIKSDPNNPSAVVISWQAPNYATTTGYVISYLDEVRLKENPNNRWKLEYLTVNEQQKQIVTTIKKLKLDTTYYFKIQARNNRAYGGSSPVIIFKTPNEKGQGGGKIFMQSTNEESVEVANESINIAKNRNYMEINLVLVIIIASGASLLGLFIILFAVLVCKRNEKRKKINESTRYKTKKNYLDENATTNMGANNNENIANEDSSESYNKHSTQQHLLLSHHMDSNTPNSAQHHLQTYSNSSNNSTLHKQQQHLKTPNHAALVISNPNHMMMTLMNPLTINNNTNNNSEYYSNMNQQLLSNNSHANSDGTDSYYQFNHYQQHNHHNLRTSSMNEDNTLLNQSDDLNKELANTSAAIAAANAAFNAPINNLNAANSANASEPLFLRHTIRPKPIALPMTAAPDIPNSTTLTSDSQSLFSNNNAHTRKSFKNLPIATATLISSSNTNNNNQSNSQHPLAFNFNDVTSKQSQQQQTNASFFVSQQANSQKLLYTARPYIIDNQVQSNLDYSNHSPASSVHSGGQPQVYDKIPPVGSVAASTKSLLQPLKSFASNNINQTNAAQSSSISIPNTPAKYCENYANMSRSPTKKHLMVSMTSQSTTTSITRNNKQSSDLIGKSIENVYEKKLSNNNCTSNQDISTEMANLEGVMKELSAMTAQQFEC